MSGYARPVQLPVPGPGPDAAVAFVREHLADLTCDTPAASETIRGGQTAADAALAALDVTGLRGAAATRCGRPSAAGRRGCRPTSATTSSTCPRCGTTSPTRRRTTAGSTATSWPGRSSPATSTPASGATAGRRCARSCAPGRRSRPRSWDEPWPRDMRCMDATVGELHADGWLVNQTRMWLASQWTVRAGARWRDGEEEFFTHLLDGSRAANRLNWQWTVGAGNGKAYGFSRWQVQKRAPGLCRRVRPARRLPGAGVARRPADLAGRGLGPAARRPRPVGDRAGRSPPATADARGRRGVADRASRSGTPTPRWRPTPTSRRCSASTSRCCAG